MKTICTDCSPLKLVVNRGSRHIRQIYIIGWCEWLLFLLFEEKKKNFFYGTQLNITSKYSKKKKEKKGD